MAKSREGEGKLAYTFCISNFYVFQFLHLECLRLSYVYYLKMAYGWVQFKMQGNRPTCLVGNHQAFILHIMFSGG